MFVAHVLYVTVYYCKTVTAINFEIFMRLCNVIRDLIRSYEWLIPKLYLCCIKVPHAVGICKEGTFTNLTIKISISIF